MVKIVKNHSLGKEEIKGEFVVTESAIEGDIMLGLLLRVLEGKIVSAIGEKLDNILG